MRVSPPGSHDEALGRTQLACGLTLLQLAQQSGKMEALTAFDELIGRFVGEKDGAGLSELHKLCITAGLSPELLDFSSEQISHVYDALMASQVGVQKIMGDIY